MVVVVVARCMWTWIVILRGGDLRDGLDMDMDMGEMVCMRNRQGTRMYKVRHRDRVREVKRERRGVWLGKGGIWRGLKVDRGLVILMGIRLDGIRRLS